MADPDQATLFDPDAVARYEKAGWQAYYERNWPRAFWLMLCLNRAAFRMSWRTAFAAALDTVRAARAFAPLEHNDVAAARRFIERFWEKARRAAGIQSDAPTLAALEIEYWVVHRQVALLGAGAPPEAAQPLVEALDRLHSACFGGTPAAMRRSAELRALATRAVDRITGHYSTDVAADWQQVDAYLQQAYRTIQLDRP